MRKSLEAVGIIAMALIVWITYAALVGPHPLPSRIPTHFDAAGNPNGWGPPATLLLLPVLAVGLYLAMTVVSRFPMAFNYPVRVTKVNLPRLQSVTLDMIAWIKTELVCLFAVLQWWIIRSVRSGRGHLPPLMVPAFIVVIFATITWHIIAIFRAASSGNDS